MLLILLICHLALVASSPFHKYPYVFLLDVGNEELEKTNTEQIRLSVPGGSIAVRYPAIGKGATIAHIRVSGIDFGTDLKANIVEGGPGCKYVVLVLMGNQGEPYDAVMTVQTVPDDDSDGSQSEDVSSGYYYDSNSAEATNPNSNELVSNEVDENVSSEDISDEYETPSNLNTQIKQEGSNVYYTFASSSDEDSASEEKDIHKQYSDSDFDEQVKCDTNDSDSDQVDDSGEPEPPHFNDDYGNEDSFESSEENEPTKSVQVYERYPPVIPIRGYGGGIRVYPQYVVPYPLPDSDELDSPDDAVDSEDDDRRDNDKYRDFNNNYSDLDDASAVAS